MGCFRDLQFVLRGAKIPVRPLHPQSFNLLRLLLDFILSVPGCHGANTCNPMEKHTKAKTTKKLQSKQDRRNTTRLFLFESRTESFAKDQKKNLNEWVFFSIVVYDHNLAMHLLASVIIKQALTINKETMKMKVAKWK